MKQPNRVLIAIATYNELENLPRLVESLSRELPEAHILIVDDDSPDRTWEWAEQAAADLPHISLIHRKAERGLGSATIAGLSHGLEQSFDLIATMDADFSHPPASLVELVRLITDDASIDVVIGSRYIAGGGIEGWPLHRRMASRVFNWLARIWLGLKTHDNTGAFRVYRANSLRKIDISKLRSSGYAYLEEILLRLQQSGAKIVEHPITFRDREEGESKVSFAVGIAVIREIFAMRFRR